MKINIPVLTLLQAMGITNKKLLYTLKHKILAQDILKPSEALQNLTKILITKKLNVV